MNTTPAAAQSPVGRVVRLSPQAHIEVLDWGGTGRPIVLLHGAGNNADEWDDFVPRLPGGYRYLALSRRGAGRSSVAPVGVTIDSLVEDIRAVMDSLRLSDAVFIGHSYAGRELTALGKRLPWRVRALIYLDAVYTANGVSVVSQLGAALSSLGGLAMQSADSTSVAAVVAYYARMGCTYTDAAVRRMREFDGTGRFRSDRTDKASLVRLGSIPEPATYKGFDGPILALRASWPLPGAPGAPRNAPFDSALVQQAMAILDPVWDSVRREMPNAQIKVIENAQHCVYASQPEQTVHAIREFLGRLDARRH